MKRFISYFLLFSFAVVCFANQSVAVEMKNKTSKSIDNKNKNTTEDETSYHKPKPNCTNIKDCQNSSKNSNVVSNDSAEIYANESNPTLPLNVLVNFDDFPGTLALGRPTDNSITFNIVPLANISWIQIIILDVILNKTSTSIVHPIINEPYEAKIQNLEKNTHYEYLIAYNYLGKYSESSRHSFWTQRAQGSSFKFSIIADSHLFTPQHCNYNRYRSTLQNVLSDSPDFLITLGDDFRTSKLKPPVSESQVRELFTGHRPYHNIISRDIPIFLVNGNHELQSGFLLDGTSDNLALFGVRNRLQFYPNPFPDSFYSGNTKTQEFLPGEGLLENYYSWTWGDALFVVLDDYWYSKNEDSWECSLGIDQFNWLKNVLSKSQSKWKFIFHHHFHCTSRGGVEVAKQYEWGGYESDERTWGYITNRPGWGDESIHQILIKNNVTVVFQGHDHLYANQDLDGIKYVTVPMPAFNPASYLLGTNNNQDAFTVGKVVRPSGHLTVEVSQEFVESNYYFVGMPGEKWKNKEVADHFIIAK